MNTPIYDSTKQSYEEFEKDIDNFYKELDRKVDQAKQDVKNWTEEKAKEMQQYFEKRIEEIKNRFQKQQENQEKKNYGAKEKLEKIKKALEVLMNPPSLDTIVKWAKSATEIYTMQYEETLGRALDIAKTTSYVATETPIVVLKITNLPNSLNKIQSIPVPGLNQQGDSTINSITKVISK